MAIPHGHARHRDAFKFEDDGPSIDVSLATVPTLTTDDTDIPDTAGPTSFAGLFTPADFGKDGFKDSDDNKTLRMTMRWTTRWASVRRQRTAVWDDTLTGDNILLRMNGDVVEGYLENATTTLAFEISVDSDGK